MSSVVCDHLLLLRLEGLHCQRCENSVRLALVAIPGVREVEIDFPSSLASVLFDPTQTDQPTLVRSVTEVGYAVASSEIVRPRE